MLADAGTTVNHAFLWFLPGFSLRLPRDPVDTPDTVALVRRQKVVHAPVDRLVVYPDADTAQPPQNEPRPGRDAFL